MMNVMKNSGFEVVSFEQFQEAILESKFDKGLEENIITHEGIKLPERQTRFSAGYDFFFPYDDITIKAGETIMFPTGIRCAMDIGNVLLLMPRSSWGMKYQMRFNNTIGVIDSDYYNAENEGHIMCMLTVGKDMIIRKNDRYMQGVFVPFYTFNDVVDVERKGGIGSTDEIK